MWQSTQARLAWGPLVIGNQVWLKVPWSQLPSVALWQVSQVVGKPAVECFGLVVASYSGL